MVKLYLKKSQKTFIKSRDEYYLNNILEEPVTNELLTYFKLFQL